MAEQTEQQAAKPRGSSIPFPSVEGRKAPAMAYAYKLMPSPVGVLTLIATEKGLAGILWENDEPTRVRLRPRTVVPDNPILVQTEAQLTEYFAGTRRSFTVPLDAAGTPFQQRVWQALLTIPFGETRSYGQLAEDIGSPNAVRAVGAANGRNPIAIITPCHRVIGATGKLTGFGGGLDAKAYLLKLESGQPDFLSKAPP